jgi:hypothetical protein
LAIVAQWKKVIGAAYAAIEDEAHRSAKEIFEFYGYKFRP